MYRNTFTPGYEVLSKSGYVFDHNSLSSAASYLVTNDFPDYAAMFYSPSDHEVMSSIKYGNFEAGYHNLNDIRESLNGLPMEFYVPSSFAVSDGVGRNDEKAVVAAKPRDILFEKSSRENLEEIRDAQREISSRRIRKVEFEDILILRKIRRTIFFDEKG